MVSHRHGLDCLDFRANQIRLFTHLFLQHGCIAVDLRQDLFALGRNKGHGLPFCARCLLIFSRLDTGEADFVGSDSVRFQLFCKAHFAPPCLASISAASSSNRAAWSRSFVALGLSSLYLTMNATIALLSVSPVPDTHL